MPLGCFTAALLFVIFVGSILVIVFSAMKSTDVYKDALARARADPAVIEALGSPIKDGFLMSGNTNVNGAAGEANLAIPISGPKGKGTIYVSAKKFPLTQFFSGLSGESSVLQLDYFPGSPSGQPWRVCFMFQEAPREGRLKSRS